TNQAANANRKKPPVRPPDPTLATSKSLVKKTFSGKNGKLPYCQFTENMKSDGEPTLLLVLHGRSGCGSDNTRQLSSPALRSLLKYLRRDQKKTIILAPHCPPNQDWIHNWGEGKGSPMKLLLEVTAAKCREFNIPADRVCISGISMAGKACYTIMAQHPGKFAKAIIVSASGSESDAAQVKGDFLIIHGEDDRLIPEDRAAGIAKLVSSNPEATAKYIRMTGEDHISCAENAFTNEVWHWLFR
ncbi:MAG: hypothetical protein J5858_12430, partial [Lentisphaeria bacterium]|nr:hypothetical protein [Lentisphaeria bacterium]